MARNTPIALDEHFAQFIDRQVASGHYDSASDVVNAGLRLLENHESKREAVLSALIDGEESGELQDLNIDAFLAAIRKPSAE